MMAHASRMPGSRLACSPTRAEAISLVSLSGGEAVNRSVYALAACDPLHGRIGAAHPFHDVRGALSRSLVPCCAAHAHPKAAAADLIKVRVKVSDRSVVELGSGIRSGVR